LGLATGHLASALAFQTHEVEPFESAARFTEGLSTVHATKQQRQSNVLLGRELWDQLAELEHEAEAITSQSRALPFSQGIQSLTIELDLTGVRNEDPGQAMQQCRLT